MSSSGLTISPCRTNDAEYALVFPVYLFIHVRKYTRTVSACMHSVGLYEYIRTSVDMTRCLLFCQEESSVLASPAVALAVRGQGNGPRLRIYISLQELCFTYFLL